MGTSTLSRFQRGALAQLVNEGNKSYQVMADALGIAKATISLKGEERIHVVEEDISLMGERVKSIVDAALNAYIQGDADRAREIALWDDTVDQMYGEIQNKTLSAMEENKETITTGKDYLLTIMYLKRISDYAKNLCEWIVYLKTGKIVEL